MEDVERVRVAHREAKGVEVNGTRVCRMYTTQVHDQMAIDKYPDVVVTAESEDLTRVVHEVKLILRCEEEVVPIAVTISFAIIVATAINRKV